LARKKNKKKQAEHSAGKVVNISVSFMNRLISEIHKHAGLAAAQIFERYIAEVIAELSLLPIILNKDYEVFKFMVLFSTDSPLKFKQEEIFHPSQIQEILLKLKNTYKLGTQLHIITRGVASKEEKFLEAISGVCLDISPEETGVRKEVETFIPDAWTDSLIPGRNWSSPMFLAQGMFNCSSDELLRRIHKRSPPSGSRHNPGGLIRNPDEDIRRAEISVPAGGIEEKAAYLRKKTRAGQLDSAHVLLAAYLGDKASLLIINKEDLLQLTSEIENNSAYYYRTVNPRGRGRKTINVLIYYIVRRWDRDAAHRGYAMYLRIHDPLDLPANNISFLVSVAADFAEHVLPIWEEQQPGDDRPHLLIEEARDWVNTFDSNNRRPINQYPLRATPAGSSVQASYVGHAASHIGDAVAAANAAIDACYAYDEEGSRHPTTASTSEEKWQRQHLIKRLLEGPVRRNPKRKSRKKVTKSHSTSTDEGEIVIKAANKDPNVSKISLGVIKSGLRTAPRRIKISTLNPKTLLIKIRGVINVMTIRIYTSDLEATTKLIEQAFYKKYSKPRRNPDEEIQRARRKANQGEDIDVYLTKLKRADRALYFQEARRLWDDDAKYVDMLIEEGELESHLRQVAVRHLGQQRFAFIFDPTAEDLIREDHPNHQDVCHGDSYPGHCCYDHLARRTEGDTEEVICRLCDSDAFAVIEFTDESYANSRGEDIWISAIIPQCAIPADDDDYF